MCSYLQASCLDKLASAAMPEFAPFAYSLARRLSTMLQADKIDPKSSSMWNVAVEQVLLQLADSETEAHEEILRMLMIAAPKLDVESLGRYVDCCIQNSSKSRQLHSERALEEASLPPREYLHLKRGDNGSDDEFSTQEKPSGDGVRGTYRRFLAKYPALRKKSVSPLLHAYLDS